MTATPRRHATVAVRTADVALGDLGVDGGEAAAIPPQARDGVALHAYVVELEHDRIALSAVGARGTPQDFVDMSEVALDVPGRVGRHRLRRRRAAPARAHRGTSPVTVGAHDLAA